MWDELLSDDDRVLLEDGTGADLDPAPDVLVVGGGALGLAIAAACVAEGLGRVQLVERGRLAGGVSGSAAGGLAPGTHTLTRPDAFCALGESSLALHIDLGHELRTVDWLLTAGAPPAPDVAARARADSLDAAAARVLEPRLGLHDAGGALHVRAQAALDPLHFAASLARRAGAVLTRTIVSRVDTHAGRITAVHTSRGAIQPGAVVFATGTEPDIAGLEPLGVATHTLKGHLIATEPAPFRLQAFLGGFGILVLQTSDGRLLAGGTQEPADHDPAVRPHIVTEIETSLRRLVPAARQLRTTHAWCCFRPSSTDELPIIDRHPALENAWVTCAHLSTGLLMAPATAQAIATWIAAGAPPELVKPFGLARLRG